MSDYMILALLLLLGVAVFLMIAGPDHSIEVTSIEVMQSIVEQQLQLP